GMTAVDLGAAPGGWTWQLTRHSIRVTAIDNAALDHRLEETGLVCHRRADGFRYRPPAPVDWLVCDMVEQPRRIAALVVDWLAAGDCRQALFNLKLPMRRRLEEIDHCRDLIDRRLGRSGVRYRLSCKQLYHDRREVTALLQRL
ncbi:MAG: 23S rRNA (cytidine(2498)-2'-O)-methyltransferase RlmM, partial [Candidatus Competibacterales bacterium]|nr:23S rRNA (cytidine(2498)-2'-O)-methyltransferase RlmM [Candidatus Competibacterales bacterium]